MTVHIGPSLFMRAHCRQSQSDAPPFGTFLPPVLNLPLSLKGISLQLDQITGLQIHGTYLSVIVPFLSLGFCH